jgi:hypothetical protein
MRRQTMRFQLSPYVLAVLIGLALFGGELVYYLS